MKQEFSKRFSETPESAKRTRLQLDDVSNDAFVINCDVVAPEAVLGDGAGETVIRVVRLVEESSVGFAVLEDRPALMRLRLQDDYRYDRERDLSDLEVYSDFVQAVSRALEQLNEWKLRNDY